MCLYPSPCSCTLQVAVSVHKVAHAIRNRPHGHGPGSMCPGRCQDTLTTTSPFQTPRNSKSLRPGRNRNLYILHYILYIIYFIHLYTIYCTIYIYIYVSDRSVMARTAAMAQRAIRSRLALHGWLQTQAWAQGDYTGFRFFFLRAFFRLLNWV